MTAPIVFVSYACDSPEHRGWVLRLAEDLRGRGIDLILDTWHLRAGADIGRFMIESVKRADRVLVVCSAKYVERADAGVGGAGYEAGLVTAELALDQGTTRFVPLMRENPTRAVLAFLGMRRYVDITDDAHYDASLAELLLELHEAADTVIPPVGPNRFRASVAAIDASETHGTPGAVGDSGVAQRGARAVGAPPAERGRARR